MVRFKGFFDILHFSHAGFGLHDVTLGAEKKSGVPYILTSHVGIAKRPN